MRKWPQWRVIKVTSRRWWVSVWRWVKNNVVWILKHQRPKETRIVTTWWKFPESEWRNIPMLTRSKFLEGLSHKLNLVLNIEED